jgi:DNA-binding NarL/FixJ family response regulator
VVIVDDVADIRLLVRLQLERDDRFEVVGEGGNGAEAIALADALQPDLMVLDRQMPTLGGVEAIPEIRRRSPDTTVVLYTAQSDEVTHRAALSAGALDVLDKGAGELDFVDRLVDALLGRAASDATVEVRVGPVSAAAARVWVANTTTILDAVAAHPDAFDEPIPSDVLAILRSFVDQWRDIAADADDFRWAARARPDDVERIVTSWAAIDLLSDDQLDEMGIHWSPPEGEPFFHALTAGVLEALRRHDETRRLAARLSEQWGE